MVRLLATFGILIISFSAIFVRLADVEPSTSAFFRTAYALPALAILWWIRRRRDLRSAAERRLAFVSGLFLGVDIELFHYTIEKIGAGLATVLGNTQVIFIALAAWLVYGERPRREALAILPLVMVGVVLIAGVGQDDAYGPDPAAGVVLGLFTGLTYAAYLFTVRASNRSLSPAVGSLFDATAGALVACAIFGWFDGGLDLVPHWPAHGWLLALALGSQVLGWTLIQQAMPRLPALETSVMLLMQPMLTMFWGYLLFAENLSLGQWSGVALVVGGIGFLSWRGGVVGPKVGRRREGQETS